MAHLLDNLDGNTLQYNSMNTLINRIMLSKEDLYEMYTIRRMSIPQIATKLGIGRTTVLKYLNKHDKI